MFTIGEIAEATGGRIWGNASGSVTGVSTDSRKAAGGELFVPLVGERFDGHDYIPAAAKNGVSVFIARERRVDAEDLPSGASVVFVADTLRAMGDLAAFHRRRFSIPVIGVTGSNGKTTVKEMLASILSLTGTGLKTEGNLNNLIGLPQMLFRLTGREQWAVLEMGMSEPGEIDRLAEIAAPRVGVITNAYAAHLESMGSVEAVARAKGELFMRLPSGGCAVCNADDRLVSCLPSPDGVRRLSFGMTEADITASSIRSIGRSGQQFTLHLPGGETRVMMRAFGIHNVMNAMAAAAGAMAMGVAPETIGKGLEQFTPYTRRFNLEELDGIVLIDDSYNANPASMRAALETLRDIRGNGRAVAVLGDMLELGTGAEQAHRELGSLAASCGIERLYLMGKMAAAVADGAAAAGLSGGAIMVAASHDDIMKDLRLNLRRGDLVLVKGSRGMAMDRVAEGLRLDNGANSAGKGVA